MDGSGRRGMATAAVVTGIGRMELRSFPLPPVGPDDGLLRVERVGVCASDPAWFYGKVALPGYPLILGHEIVGRIEALGARAREAYGLEPGDRVVVEGSIRCSGCRYCIQGEYHLCDRRRSYGSTVTTSVAPALWGGYSQFLYLAPGSVLHRVSERLPAEAAVVVAAVLGNAMGWVAGRGDLRPGQSIVVQGVGPQGLAAVVAAREAGASLVVAAGLGRDRRRLELAREFGADRVVNVEEEDLRGVVAGLTGGRMADRVIDLTGHPETIARSLDLVRKGGCIIQAGLTGDRTLTPLPLDRLIFKEIRLQGVFAHQAEGVRAALQVAESRRYPLERMVTHTLPLREARRALDLVARRTDGEDPVKVLLDPWQKGDERHEAGR